MNKIYRLFGMAVGAYMMLTLLFFTSCNPNEVDEIASTTQYSIGDVGPAGGFIFYDKGIETNGWRYLEAAPYDIPSKQWGKFHTLVNTPGEGFGSGRENTARIIAFHDGLTGFYGNPKQYDDVSDGTVAAKACAELTINGFNDWHLPSKAESYEMYKSLHLQGLGDFDSRELYWTSTEHSAGDNTAIATDFDNGSQAWLCKQCFEVTSLRAVRYF